MVGGSKLKTPSSLQHKHRSILVTYWIKLHLAPDELGKSESCMAWRAKEIGFFKPV